MGHDDKESPPSPAQSAADYSKLYQSGIDVYLRNLPQILQSEADYRGSLDPQRIAQQQALQGQFGAEQYQQQLDALHQLDPESAKIRKQLSDRVSGDLASGYDLPADYQRQIEQSVRGAQAARGNILGQGPATAEATVKGKLAYDLYQQRLNNAGSFLSSPTPEQQLLAVQGVQPDRSMAYVNPNAGTGGTNFGLQNYQNLLAGQQLQQNNNPWLQAAGGAASGAAAGSAAGPYGALAGAAVGGALGYFSDERLKEDIHELGTTKSGIPLIRFKFIGRKPVYIGARAQDVQKVNPEAVIADENGYLRVNYDMLGDVPYFQLGAN